MATALQGTYGGGTGGKLRKKQSKRSATPYDKPPIAPQSLGNPNGRERNGWISKLIDPASRIIARSANRFFSSVFQKRLTAPPPPPPDPELNLSLIQELNDVEPINTNMSPADLGQVEHTRNFENNIPENTDVNQLEQLLKQKTFTKVEFDRLTALLRARVVDSSQNEEMKITHPSTPKSVSIPEETDHTNIPYNENGTGNKLFGGSYNNTVKIRAPEEVSSPAELAKAYMGTRSSNISPSASSLWRHTFKNDASLTSSLSAVPKSSAYMALGTRSNVRFSGMAESSENGYMTPRPRGGRSAIYNMARTPYSRVNYTPSPSKGTVRIGDGSAGPSTSSQWTQTTASFSGGKQVLKRRNSVLDNDIGSIGPIRRIRQKSNLLVSTSKNSALFVPKIMDSNRSPVIAEPHSGEIRDNENSYPNISSIPPQSSEMARKILQQLDKLVPSPKEKSPETKLAITWDESSRTLTHEMLQGKALKSTEDIDSLRFKAKDTPVSSRTLTHEMLQGKALKSTEDIDSLRFKAKDTPVDGLSQTVPRSFVSQNMVKVSDNDPVVTVGERNKLSLESEITTLKESSIIRPQRVVTVSALPTKPNQWAFQMSAPEDSLDLDEENHGTMDAVLSSSEKEKDEAYALSLKATISNSSQTKKLLEISSQSKSMSNLLNNKGELDTRQSNGPVVRDEDAGFAFSVLSTPGTKSLEPALSPQVSFGMVSPKEQPSPPLSSFGTKTGDTSQSMFKFSTTATTAASVPVNLQFNAGSGIKLETKSTTETTAKPATTSEIKPSSSPETVALLPSLPKTPLETKPSSPPLTTNIKNVKEGISLPSGGMTTSSTIPTSSSTFSFGTSSSGFSNGSLTSTTSTFSFSTSAPPSTSVSSVLVAPSSFSSTTATVSTSGSSSIPSLFMFGTRSSSSIAPCDTVPPLISKKESDESISKTNLLTPSFSSIASNSSSVYGFNTSSSSATSSPSFTSVQLQSSAAKGSSTGTLFGTKPTPNESGLTSFSQNTSNPFVSSASSVTFGSNASSAAAAVPTVSSIPFGSSTSSPATFTSTSTPTTSSSFFSFTASSFATTGAATSMFGSSSQPASSTPTFGSGPEFSSTGTTFQFGGSSTATSSTTTPLTFGSSTAGGHFSFTSATSSSSPAPSIFSSRPIFGAPSLTPAFGSTSSEQMNVEDSMAEDTVQAASPPATLFGQVGSSAAPSPFTFGASSLQPTTPVFQFGGQQNLISPAPPSFQPTGNLEFSSGGSFSLGTGGGDKSGRRIIKVRRDKHRKK